ncbi:N-acetylglucosamine-6-phosphate deacetylase [Georgenia alba]|uniref:N-acetylglucosamine-6-phosphate deacetylase n=1 Tax=Georgenia alba TaxID=2233858 RepID=A0ABW2QED4_9MICO
MSDVVLRGRVVTPDRIEDDGVVVIHDDTISWVGAASTAADASATGSDLTDALTAAIAETRPDPTRYLLPGLVDLHNHGGGGASFPDARTREDALRAVAEHRRHGTTSVVASLVTASPETLRERVALLAELADDGEIAGIHLEGPFLSAARCGAQDPNLIIPPDPQLTEDLLRLGRGHVVTMTLAPERDGVEDVLTLLADARALPSWGHTDARPDEARAALAAGARLLAPSRRRATVTHLFNGMRPWHHRDPGPVGEFLAAAAGGEAVVELIGDGTHLQPDVVREVHAIVGRQGAVLVTDAMAAAGMSDGAYRLGTQDVVVAGGVARLADGESIAGGTAHLLDVVRTSVEAGVPLVDAVHMAATGPAAVLGDTSVGALEAGRRADVLITDENLYPVRVIRHGKEVT